MNSKVSVDMGDPLIRCKADELRSRMKNTLSDFEKENAGMDKEALLAIRYEATALIFIGAMGESDVKRGCREATRFIKFLRKYISCEQKGVIPE
jgi:hypothetical protein